MSQSASAFGPSLRFAPPARIICPHCHRPIDPAWLEEVVADRLDNVTQTANQSANPPVKPPASPAEYRICPECDEPIVWSMGALPGSSKCPPADGSPQ